MISGVMAVIENLVAIRSLVACFVMRGFLLPKRISSTTCNETMSKAYESTESLT